MNNRNTNDENIGESGFFAKPVLSDVFANPKGELCTTVTLFGKQLFTLLRVEPRFDGYDVAGNVINPDDWCWVAGENCT